MKSRIDNLTLICGISEEFPVGSKAFKEFELDGIVDIPDDKPDIGHIICVSSEIGIIRTCVVPTPSGHSCEGQVLTGKRVIVEGEIRLKVEFTADCPFQPVHVSFFSIPFCAPIAVKKESDCHSRFEVSSYVEDVYVRQLDKRRIYEKILVVLNAVPSLGTLDGGNG